jgi:hypothetical protein
MLEYENDRIYLRKVKTLYANIFAIILFGLFCVNFYFREMSKGISFLNGKNLVIFIVICFFIFVIRTVFSGGYTIFIDTSEKTIVFQQGYGKHKEAIKIKYEEIKSVVMVKYHKRYAIDIYDNALNAYECFEDKNHNNILEAAGQIENILGIKIDDRTDEENYEGFRQRKV